MIKTHKLHWPIQGDNNQAVNEVTINPLTIGERRALDGQHKDTELERAYISACTELSLDQIKKLVTPDFNSIMEMVGDMLTLPVSQLVELKAFDPDEPTLYVPLKMDDGSTKLGYTLKAPNVATTDLMEQHTDEWERTLFISSSCTGFTVSELERMSVPDWNHLQGRLVDFLVKPADYFRRET